MGVALPNLPNTVMKELSLDGQCSYHIDSNNIVINAERITNNREHNNISGALTLELWALPTAYEGGSFSGCCVASQFLGELQGQYHFEDCVYNLAIQTPGEGSWTMVLMLREWHNGAYVTRDYINFPQKVVAHYKLVLSLSGSPVIYPN
ncbi:MAG: hypothetical protein MI976_19155 [Pseudomonadales bacterium]|nr:hypothetical protein [Pseudomonadales bacterium]